MSWQRVIAFDQSKGGNRPGYCLQNVRLGYGIAGKYPDAITAWNHTQQHKDRNVPLGVDVPLYYSYKDLGHINVRLASGKVWSDGTVYNNLAAYEAYHSPIYLGWGDSVNDVRVIKEGEDMYNGQSAEYWYNKSEEYQEAAAYWEKSSRNRLAIIVEKDKQIQALEAQIAAGGGSSYVKVITAGTDLYIVK